MQLRDILARCGQLAGTSMPSHISGAGNSCRMVEARSKGWEAQHLDFAASFQMIQAEEIAFCNPRFRISTLYSCHTKETQCHCP
jgi:hypothetical protein